MCEYLKRMSPQDTPTDDIRWWSGLAHSVVEYTGPKPFGMDGSVCLWLHERSAAQLLDMCDEVDAKFSDLKNENAKLRDIAHDMWRLLLATGNDDLVLSIEVSGVAKEVIDAEELAKTMRELGIEV